MLHYKAMGPQIQHFTLNCCFSLGAGTQKDLTNFACNPKSSNKKDFLNTFLKVSPETKTGS